MTILAILVITLLTAAPLSAQQSGALIGCITDGVGQRVPGVTVVARTEGTQQTAVANAEGCYEAQALATGVYRATALLSGFDNETREKIAIGPGSTVRLNFEMRVSPMCECLASPATLRERWERADAVAHVRITNRDTHPPAQRGFFGHTAEVLEVFKRHPFGGPTDHTVEFLQGQSSGEPLPYDAGEELIVFLVWSPAAQRFLHHRHSESAFDWRRNAGLQAELRMLSAGK